MRGGDSLLAVDDVPVVGRSVDQVRDLLHCPPNTQVKVRSVEYFLFVLLFCVSEFFFSLVLPPSLPPSLLLFFLLR